MRIAAPEVMFGGPFFNITRINWQLQITVQLHNLLFFGNTVLYFNKIFVM